MGLYFIIEGVVALSQFYFVDANPPKPEMFYFYQGLVSVLCGVILSIFYFSLSKLWTLLRFAGT